MPRFWLSAEGSNPASSSEESAANPESLKEHLWDFIRGKLFIFILVELDALCQILPRAGLGIPVSIAWPRAANLLRIAGKRPQPLDGRPPGAGKSMLAARLPGILPPLEPAEALGIM